MKVPTNSTKENNQEMYARWYFEDLVENGLLKSFDREAETWEIIPKATFKKEIHLVRDPNRLEEITLLQPLTYTYDFRLIWEPLALNVMTEILLPDGHFRFGVPLFVSHFIDIEGEREIVSYVDVKPHMNAAKFGGGKNASYYTFPLIQKMLYQKGLYINKMIPDAFNSKVGVKTCMFAKSFTPKRYFFTDKSGSKRKIHHRPIKTFKSFYEHRLKIVEKLIVQERKKTNKNAQQERLFDNP